MDSKKAYNMEKMDWKMIIKCIIHHTPNERLNESEINKVKKYGLVHFTRKENIDAIEKQGIVCGMDIPMKKIEKNFTWFYINNPESFCRNRDFVLSKGEKRKQYDAYIVINNLTKEQIEKLKIRRKADSAVIYPGTLLTPTIKGKLLWDNE